MLRKLWVNTSHWTREKLSALGQWTKDFPGKLKTKLHALVQGIERAATGAIASSLRGTLKSTAGLALLAVAAVAGYFILQAVVLHIARPAHMIVVQPFESSQDAFKRLAMTGKIASDIVVDEFNTSANNAIEFRGYQSNPSVPIANSSQRASPSQLHYGSVRKLLKIPVQSSYGIEIKGISLDMLVNMYDRIRYETWEISGDLTGGDDSPAVAIRLSKNGTASQWYIPLAASAQLKDSLIQLLRNSADKVLEAWDPEIMTRAYLQEGSYSQAEKAARMWSRADPGNSEPVYYIVEAKLYEGIQCSEADCPASTDPDPSLTDYEDALALAKFERQRLGEPGFLSRLASWWPTAVAYNERDRLEDAIAESERTICAYTIWKLCESYLKDADDRYSRLARKYKDDEHIAVNFAFVKTLEQQGTQAVGILDGFEKHHAVDAEFYFNKAGAQESAGNVNGEIEAYRKAVLSDPSNVLSQVYFMSALQQRGSIQDAVEAVDTYRWLSAMAPLDPKSFPRSSTDLHIVYAWGLVETNDFTGAAAALRPVLNGVSIPKLDEFAEEFRRKKHANEALEILQTRIETANAQGEAGLSMVELFTEAAQIETDLGNLKQAAVYAKQAASARQKLGHAININLVAPRQDSNPRQ